jgi:hypothetical protein
MDDRQRRAKEKRAENMRLYYQKNKAKIKRYVSAWRKANPVKCQETLNRWVAKNPDKVREYKNKYKHKCYWAERMEKPINERAHHLTIMYGGTKQIEKLRAKNLEYLYRKAPELKDKVLSDDELMDYILKNENI